MRTWKYRIFYNVTEAQLNQYGKDGWELVSMVQLASGDFCYACKKLVILG